MLRCGAELAVLWDEASALAAFATLFTALNSRCFKKRSGWRPPAANAAAGKP
jgi:hypothetical protein